MITQQNIRTTRQKLAMGGRSLGEARTLVVAPRAGSAASMSPQELEFAVRSVANSVVALYNTLTDFLEQIERDSRTHR